jgi:small-conductance mechanosensitive channel
VASLPARPKLAFYIALTPAVGFAAQDVLSNVISGVFIV